MNSNFYDSSKVTQEIERYCRESVIKEEGFAEIIGVDPVHLSRIKGGKSSSYETLCKIAVVVGKDIQYFLKPIPEEFAASVKKNLQPALS